MRKGGFAPWAHAAVAALGLVAIWVTGARVGETRDALVRAAPAAPDAMVSLQLARSPREAARIVKPWRGLAEARENLARDYALILTYTATAGVLALLWLTAAGAPGWLRVATPLAALAAGAADVLENLGLGRQLHVRPPFHLLSALAARVLPTRNADVVLFTRSFAQSKFLLLLAVTVIGLTAALGALRRRWLGRASDAGAARTFDRLVDAEKTDILAGSGRTGTEELKAATGPSGEPWVGFRTRDIVGLALSGGGIRSATFNLGLLTGLCRLDVLKKIDYLATVSGGGYVGSFWTAYLANRERGSHVLWPPRGGGEPGTVRHLREFSRFLAPRWGFFETEMWEAIVTVGAGLLLALASTVSVLGLGLVAWLVLNFCLACPERAAGIVTVVVLTVAVFGWFEWAWGAGTRLDGEDEQVSRRTFYVSAGVAVVLVGVLQWRLVDPLHRVCWLYARTWITAPVPDAGYAGWWSLTGMKHWWARDAWFVSPRLFELAVVWLAAGAVLLVLRPICLIVLRRSGRERTGLPAYDRTVMRLLGSAIGWAAIATLWHASINLQLAGRQLATAAAVSGGLFATLRNWIGTAFRTGQQPGPLDRIKPVLPQLLAYLTIALAAAGVGSLLIRWGGDDWLAWYEATACLTFVIAVMLLLDPTEIGLHAFYRDRIVRAYAGASNPRADGVAANNRQTDPRAGDDVPLARLPARPLHLVCCAANDVSGDPVETLGRGARSATLSHYGIAMGDGWLEAPARTLTLGSAVTASAAAFNSNMGAVSMQVGPVVSFLMSALNLRLGLWVPNPCHATPVGRRLLPGALFFREMFALTFADDDAREIHLSDGGHFDNLALYELVRRHCRYVIVSDCGADPTVAFEDFGNAARRIREDFGVDIDVDLSALHPDAQRRSRQHVAVGKIHYSDFDEGILVYVKPTLTGDEPPDVIQYATRNTQFPHEPTSDQFYDEAQWESYRKLGEHTARFVFGFIDRYRADDARPEPSADWIFTTARQDWYPTPPGLAERIGRMCELFGLMESELQREGAAPLLEEIFPELRWLGFARGGTPDHAGQAANLSCLLRVTQLMERVWEECALDTAWNHPLNLGWVNGFGRWATAPTFRMWWPILRPRFSAGFQRFMQERFHALDHDDGPQTGMLSGPYPTIPVGLTADWWQQTKDVGSANGGAPAEAWAYNVDLRSPAAGDPQPIQVGLVLVRKETDTRGSWACWTSDDFCIPASLWGAGFGGDFLEKLVTELLKSANGVAVYVTAPSRRNDPGSWTDRLSFVEFYKAAGFQIVAPETQMDANGKASRAVRLERT